ncbi:polymorphic toxin type 44 domain-containing protein [Clostridium tagluense]|nr:polymorphic toxin type 44 domain-containing protein [Clostridium tagluense]MBW9159688.1 hypothetical protein [Clostridium tagluense]
MDKVHKMVVKRGLASLNSDGTIEINTNSLELGVNENLFIKYLKNISDKNFAVKEGALSIDGDFNVKIASTEEIIKAVSDKDKQKSMLSPRIIIDPNELPGLNAYNQARSNRDAVKSIYNAGYTGGTSAAACFSRALAYWVAKVRPNGAWDYKVVSGYSPYSRQWNAHTRYASSAQTTEWFGNYAYGLSGSFLFPLSTLLSGGYYAGMGAEDSNDTQSITWGYMSVN